MASHRPGKRRRMEPWQAEDYVITGGAVALIASAITFAADEIARWLVTVF